LGEKLDVEEYEKRQIAVPEKTIQQKEKSIEQRFVKIYNNQGHYSAS
jgi:hypothetical protein